MFMTGLALVVLYVIIFTVLLNVGVQFGLRHRDRGGLLFSQYYFSDKIAMFSMHAKEVTPAQEPKLHEIVDRLCLARQHGEAPRRRRRDGHPQRLRDRAQSRVTR